MKHPIQFSVTQHTMVDDWTKIFLTWIFVVLILLFVIMNALVLAGLITLIGLTIAILSTTPSQKPAYSFDSRGLTINKRHWFWHEFQLFTVTVTPEDVKTTLWPVYHFRLPIIIHAPYAQAGQTIKLIGHHLPQRKGIGETLTDLFLRVTRM